MPTTTKPRLEDRVSVTHSVQNEDSGLDTVKNISPLLVLVHLVWKLNIPILDPYVSDAQKQSQIATGILGKGGQYVVDRFFENQRYFTSTCLVRALLTNRSDTRTSLV